MSEPKKPGGDPKEFKKGLKDALQRSADSHNSDVVHRFCVDWGHNHRCALPPECDGSHDRTYGYHTLTTVLRTLREESLPLLCQCWLPFSELQDGCLEVLGHDVPEKLQKTRIRGASEVQPEPRTLEDVDAENRKRLAEQCRLTIRAARIVLTVEKDHVMQHQLISLIGELEWCAREYGGEK